MSDTTYSGKHRVGKEHWRQKEIDKQARAEQFNAFCTERGLKPGSAKASRAYAAHLRAGDSR